MQDPPVKEDLKQNDQSINQKDPVLPRLRNMANTASALLKGPANRFPAGFRYVDRPASGDGHGKWRRDSRIWRRSLSIDRIIGVDTAHAYICACSCMYVMYVIGDSVCKT